jgi:NAD(P)-dependent dehydrogenase (short-subunit alcohol dehydrogenase family)
MQVILTSRTPSTGKAAVRELNNLGLDVIYQQLDVTDTENIDALVEKVKLQMGRIDILVNNAGIYLDRGISPLEVDLALVRETMDTNTFGPLYLSQKLIPLMRRHHYGRIVNVSSRLGSLTDMRGRALAYRLSKTALVVVTRVLAAEVKGQNILVNAVDPGWVRTDMGGAAATRSLAEGADTAVWLATLPDDGPSGGFFRDRRPRSW